MESESVDEGICAGATTVPNAFTADLSVSNQNDLPPSLEQETLLDVCLSV